jgi:hypothetical protein
MNDYDEMAKSADLKRVAIWVCQPCLDGESGECHTPGCIQWMRRGEERLDFQHQYEICPSTPEAKDA